MRENWRETLPDPATSPMPTQRINRVYSEDRQRQRARRQADRMKKALDETDRRDKKIAEIFKTVAAVLVIFLVFGALAVATISLSGTQKKAAAEEQEATTENPWDGSQAGANAVTVEDLKAEYDTNGLPRVGSYSLSWDIHSTSDELTVAGASDGPIYDLPLGWTSFACHDRTMNRSYTIIVSDVGTFAVIPTLDADGEQVITERY